MLRYPIYAKIQKNNKGCINGNSRKSSCINRI